MLKKVESVYLEIVRGLRKDGEATFAANGRNFRLFFEDAAQEVEVCEVVGGELEYLFSFIHESEIADWLEELAELDECGDSA